MDLALTLSAVFLEESFKLHLIKRVQQLDFVDPELISAECMPPRLDNLLAIISQDVLQEAVPGLRRTQLTIVDR